MSDTRTAPPALIGIEPAAARIGVTVRQLRQFIADGNAPQSARIGRRRYFRTADVDAWIDAQFDTQGR